MNYKCPASEKLLYLINLCDGRGYVTIYEIIQYFDCTYRTASRLMNKLNDMQHEIDMLSVKMITGLCNQYEGESKMIKVKIGNK